MSCALGDGSLQGELGLRVTVRMSISGAVEVSTESVVDSIAPSSVATDVLEIGLASFVVVGIAKTLAHVASGGVVSIGVFLNEDTILVDGFGISLKELGLLRLLDVESGGDGKSKLKHIIIILADRTLKYGFCKDL